MSAPRLLVTRPEREAVRWVAALRAAGVDAVALPLIEIAPLTEPALLRARLQALPPQDAWMFVSAAAADHFLGLAGDLRPAKLRCWATGPGTAAGLRAAGVPESAIDVPAEDSPQFDSEHLLELVRPQLRPGLRVLIVRGADAAGRVGGRDWLARQLLAAGAVAEELAAYRRLAPTLDAPALQLAAAGASGSALWLFSSSEAIANLRRALPGQDWHSARAIVTHERIAAAARDAGFGEIRVCRPTLPALLASIESFA